MSRIAQVKRPRQPKRRRRARSASQQIFVVLGIGTILGVAAFATDNFVTNSRQPAAAVTQSDDEIYTGSILFTPNRGNLCHQLLFDNITGGFADNGLVDCDQAAYHGLEVPKRWSADRVRVISTGFRSR